MLKLAQITKRYTVGDNVVEALRGIDLEFRDSEFVSILGPSGCGKTTTLNIIGGLDRYTSGELIINGRSTKQYKDRDWDAYRNHSIGFVFQSYNLIPHQSVLANVELALTLSGVPKAERRRRAKQALEQVGLADQMHKKPNQMSGGQMQRVAIARALINDPDILLADEPTGALDSETSQQVMQLLRQVAQDRLVIMVTHNPELAQAYSTRIIQLRDGQVISDSDPYRAPDPQPIPPSTARARGSRTGKTGKTSMSFRTALSLSLHNLMTKKGRTVLTSFAGSIGIIGIALILALSTGINAYINQVQEDTLSSYPITIQAESVDMTAMLSSLMGAGRDDPQELEQREEGRVYASTVLYDLMDSMLNAQTVTNDLAAFKQYLDQGGGGIGELADIRYSYDLQFDIYNEDADGNLVKSDVASLMQQAMSTMYGGDYSSYFESMDAMYESMDVWEELMPGQDGALIDDQLTGSYELLYGRWPTAYDELILFVDENHEISDLMLYALGLMSQQEMEQSLTALQAGQALEGEAASWTYEQLCQTTFQLILPAEYFQYDEHTGTYVDLSATQAGVELLYNSPEVGLELKVVGIAQPGQDAALTSSMTSGSVGYTSALTDYAIQTTAQAQVVRDQLASPDTDVLTALPFPTGQETEPTDQEMLEALAQYVATLSIQQRAELYLAGASQPDQAAIQQLVDRQLDGLTREDIVAMITQQYAGEMGVEGETITSYIEGMSDEELFAQVEQAVAAQAREQYAQTVAAQLEALSVQQRSDLLELSLANPSQAAGSRGLSWEQLRYLHDNHLPPTVSQSTYAENLDRLGYVDLDHPDTISLYADTFVDKDAVAQAIQDYNAQVGEQEQITYTDYVALLMSSITDIISGISYLLIAFVSISLVVSSIMIGIITYISVLERTKEIGILRAVGASKRDVSRVFNAETLIVGLCAGLIGIGVTLLLTLPINALLLRLTGLTGLRATLPVAGGAILVAISTGLTILAGLIPAKFAARKDPVDALRSD
ncbi:MAG TPA: ABC transporter ATP-binding protein/permease [Candidatus Enterenecus merdae]|nr:ABC transporter ATP-binding protein/permease [Candidatus Enterenecus merdae]